MVPGGNEGWSAVGVDEFLRSYLTPRGRAAFYAAARNIYLEEPDKFWSELRALQGESLFVWGRQDRIVPIGFARHVREALPGAEHLELDCGHVPQLEAPRETHAAVAGFLATRAGRRGRAVSAAAPPRTRLTRLARVPSLRTIRAATRVRPRVASRRRATVALNGPLRVAPDPLAAHDERHAAHLPHAACRPRAARSRPPFSRFTRSRSDPCRRRRGSPAARPRPAAAWRRAARSARRARRRRRCRPARA